MQYLDTVYTCSLPCSAADAYAWHVREGAFERLSAPWAPARVIEREGSVEAGGRVTLSVPAFGPIRLRWVARHDPATPGVSFRDVQERGPFARWEHEHRFVEGDAGVGAEVQCVLEDRVRYALPLGALGRFALGSSIARDLERLFAYRHRVTLHDLAAFARTKEKPRMRILISGASGLVGSHLVPFLTTQGHEVLTLVRRAPRGPQEVRWDPDRDEIDAAALEGIDAVVHLAGESVASGRWTEERKRRILESRERGTSLLASALARLARKPKVLASASAIGFYGDRGDAPLDESSPAGQGFLAEVCQAWERSTGPAEAAGIRCAHLRFGIILSPRGGALGRMLLPFRLGGGGRIGDGAQVMSWIALDDALAAILHVLASDAVTGPVNVVAPHPVTNAVFTKALGRAVRRPAIVPLPTFAARLAFGEMADAMLLASQRVQPKRLLEGGFAFSFPTLDEALAHMLGAPVARLEPAESRTTPAALSAAGRATPPLATSRPG